MDPSTRRKARWEILNGLARRLDMRVYNHDLAWWRSAQHLEVWRRFPASNLDVKDRRFVLHSLARSVADLPGDTAECGVYEGASSFLICSALQGGRHHVFDSFAGLSAPGDRDDSPTNHTAWQEGDLSVPLRTVQQNLSEFNHVDYHVGWIPDEFPAVADRTFRFVHVDVDLYQPTLDSVQFFHERLVPGGILVCDDFGFSTCPGARQALIESAARWPEEIIELTTGQGVIIRR